MANTQILLYVALLKYSFTLVSGLQVQTAMFARKGYRLEGKAFRFIHVSSSTECAHWCLKDQRCLSVNYGSTSSDSQLGICELNNSTREKNTESLKCDTGFTYYESLYRTPIPQSSPTGTPTTVYTTQSTPRNATDCSYYSPHGTSGVHRIFDTRLNKTFKAYCHFDRQKTWTMVLSFAYSHNDKLSQKPFWVDRPYSDASPNFDLYRMALKRMENQRKLATEWRAVCNYNGSMLDQLDTVRGKFKDFDPMLNKTTGSCKKVQYVNVRGKSCTDCTAMIFQSSTQFLHVDSMFNTIYARANAHCDFENPQGAVASEDNFGFYANTNSNFTCSSHGNSTTSWWFGN